MRDQNPETHHEMTGETLGSDWANLPKIPEPNTWDPSYGYDHAVAIAVVPERALIFWEVADVQASGKSFSLVRMRIRHGNPVEEKSWPVEPVGRFQDSGLEPGSDYLWIISERSDGETINKLATNPVRMPTRTTPVDTPDQLPSSIELAKLGLNKASNEGDSV